MISRAASNTSSERRLDALLPLQARQFGIGLCRASALCHGAAGQYLNRG